MAGTDQGLEARLAPADAPRTRVALRRGEAPMIETCEELERLLVGTELGGAQAVAADVPGTAEVALAIPIAPDRVLDSWRCARHLLEATRRWPVVVALWDQFAPNQPPLEACIRAPYFFQPDPRGVLGRATTIDVDAFLAGLHTEDPDGADDDGSATSDIDWWVPDTGAALIFLPCTTGAETLAYLEFFAADGQDSAPYVALLRRWQDRYGAELVAHYGTMLEFVVARPPMSMEDARVLAREQIAIAPCTTLLPGVPLEAHARTLLGRHDWFLHERP